MAFGVLLWVCWMCLLFGSIAGMTSRQGYEYRFTGDSKNLLDDDDSSNWDDLNNPPTGLAYRRYNKPSAAKKLQHLVPTPQNPPNSQLDPNVGRLVNGESRSWEAQNPDKPLLFPVSPANQPSDPPKPKPGLFQPQSTPLQVPTSSWPVSPSTGDTTPYVRRPVDYGPVPSSAYQVEQFPSVVSSRPEPVGNYEVSGSGSSNQNFNSGSSSDGGSSSSSPQYISAAGSRNPYNTGASRYSDAYTVEGSDQANYVDEGSSAGYVKPKEPSFPSNGGPWLSFPYWRDMPSFSNFVEMNRRLFATTPRLLPRRVSHLHPQKVSHLHPQKVSHLHPQKVSHLHPQKVSHLHPQKVSHLIPPRRPSRYFIQSRNGYQRARALQSGSRYFPEYYS